MNISRLTVILAMFPGLLLANPEEATLVTGNARFEGINTNELNIHPTDRSIIHWESFSINPSEITRFIQGSKDAAVLNRVTGDQMSQILGSLQSDGKVYLINPNGVLVGKDGMIDVGSFIASSFDIPDSAFINGEDLHFTGTSLAPVINQGVIEAKTGDVLFFAHRVENSGFIAASAGDVFMGAGHSILVGVEGKKYVYVRPELPGDGIENSGSIEAVRAILSANANPFALGIQNKGVVQAVDIAKKDGEIYLVCKGSQFQNYGRLVGKEIKVDAEDALTENIGSMSAPGGTVTLHSFSQSPTLTDQKPFSNRGNIEGDSVTINSAKFESAGLISASKINIFTPGTYVETSGAKLTGQSIYILAGNYFSSGTVESAGGKIEIDAERFIATAARYSTAGAKQGGQIKFSSTSLEKPMHLNKHVILDVSGKSKGGNIFLNSPLPVESSAQINLDGKNKGTLTVPSTISARDDLPYLIDPNPAGDTLLWTSLVAQNEQFYAVSSYEETIRLVVCPPVSVELVDPNPTLFPNPNTFGDTRVMLPSGNAVVTKPDDSFGGMSTGAAYLYNASTGALISTLRGSSPNDLVGFSGVVVLTNGNYVILSEAWNGITGAATWASGTTGVSGVVSAANSLVGSLPNDDVGRGATALTNGNYVVTSPFCTIGGVSNAGGVTWCDGATGGVGPVTAANSLHGSTMGDLVGSSPTIALANGNYVVTSSNWLAGVGVIVGAVTWGNGLGGTIGPVTGGLGGNSLTGSVGGDRVGSGNVVALTNGNYVVASSQWSNGGATFSGAATWCEGSTAGPRTVGPVTIANSLVGSTSNDNVSGSGITALTNGNYVVGSSQWANGLVLRAGASTWGNGLGGTVGAVSAVNSIVGSTQDDNVGSISIALTNGHFVVASSVWINGPLADVGAVTWCDGSTAGPRTFGPVSAANSLIGGTTLDRVGSGSVIALTNGNYVVRSPLWDDPAGPTVNVGAATWGNGSTAGPRLVGLVTTANSLHGTTANDFIGTTRLVALTNNNYVVVSESWHNGAVVGAGAVTWGDGAVGITGPVTSANSLVGTQANDSVGIGGVVALTNGDYVVSSFNWDNGAIANVGAVTWGNGATGTTGPVTAANSLIGVQANDRVGRSGLIELPDGKYAIASSLWDDGATADAGAVTLGDGATGTFCDGTYGPVSSSNSLIGPNATTGLQGFTVTNIGTTSTGLAVVLLEFTDYLGQQRVFVFPFNAIPVPPIPPIPSPAGVHAFAVAISEVFAMYDYGWVSFEGALQPYCKFPPYQTYKGLNLWIPSLVIKTDEVNATITIRE